MSTITIAGNLGADPELSVTTNGKTVANATVYENRRRPAADGGWEDAEPNVHQVQVWGAPAEHLAESAGKGSRVVVTGQVMTDRWTDEPSGQERTRQHIRADEIGLSLRFHGARATSASTPSGDGQETPQQ